MTRAEAIELIQNERFRQIGGEGWDADHDDKHRNGSLLTAAVMYYQHAAHPERPLSLDTDGRPIGWPWDRKWWKPKDKVRDLVRAGGLCLAERDRLRRLAIKSRSGPPQRLSRRYMPPHVRQKYSLIVKALVAA